MYENGQNQGLDDQEFDQDQQQSRKPIYEKYQQKYGPQYQGEELKTYRRRVFDQNSQLIQNHNKNGEASYRIGQNHLMYEDPDQFIDKIAISFPYQATIILRAPPNFRLNPIDWRQYMTQAQNQGKYCSSAYAFSTVSILQAYFSIYSGSEPIAFSSQQIVDCCKDSQDGCNGCKGGWPQAAMMYVAEKGLQTEQNYPYVNKQQKCRTKRNSNTKKLLNEDQPYFEVSGVDSISFALSKGPVSVLVDASYFDPLYVGQVYTECPQQEEFKYNHVVVLSGLTEDNVWIVRNSWGKDWGDQGYIYLPYGNSCGILTSGLVPNLIQSQQYQLFQVQQQQQSNYDLSD